MRNSIKNRLLKTFALMVVLPVLALFILLNFIYWITSYWTIVDQAEAVLDEAENAVTAKFDRYEAMLSFLEKDLELIEASQYHSGQFVSQADLEKLHLLADGYASSISSINHLTLLYQNGLFLCTQSHLELPERSQMADWYDACLADPEKTHYFSYNAGENPLLAGEPHYASSLSVSRAICDPAGQPVAVANLTIQGEDLGALLTAAYGRQGGQTYLVTPGGTLVNSPLRYDELVGIDNRNYLKTERLLQNIPLTIINFMPLRPFFSQQYLTLSLGILSSLVFMLFFVAHARFTVRQFVKPIEELRGLMSQAQHGNLQVTYQPDTQDEFEDLAESFNQMVAELRRLIDQVYIEQSSKRKAEVKALMASIKPHFLYNTLETIHWMARRYDANDIVEAVDALSDLFRVGFSANHELGTVETEFSHVESYLKIQKLRYHDILDYTLEMDPAVRHLPVMQTILQPIVENALYHGIKESGNPGRIDIHARLEDDNLLMVVRDDGWGMTPDTLDQLRMTINQKIDLDPARGHGLSNVQQRLTMTYGSPFGITIQSEPNQGTEVTLRLPVLAARDDTSSRRFNTGGDSTDAL